MWEHVGFKRGTFFVCMPGFVDAFGKFCVPCIFKDQAKEEQLQRTVSSQGGLTCQGSPQPTAMMDNQEQPIWAPAALGNLSSLCGPGHRISPISPHLVVNGKRRFYPRLVYIQNAQNETGNSKMPAKPETNLISLWWLITCIAWDLATVNS